jgi:hypothetical protein
MHGLVYLKEEYKQSTNIGVHKIPTRFVKLHYGTLKEASGVPAQSHNHVSPINHFQSFI